MLKKITLSLFFMVLIIASLGPKIGRYSEALRSTMDKQLEQLFLQAVKEEGWIMTYKAPLNTNNSHFVYVITHQKCPSELLVHILNNDAGDNLLLAQYLGHTNIHYLLNGEIIHSFPSARAYIANLQRSIIHIFSDAAPLPLLLAVSGPITQHGCSLQQTR